MNADIVFIFWVCPKMLQLTCCINKHILKMLIAITSLLMNLAIYIALFIIIIIGSEYVIDFAVWAKIKLYTAIITISNQFDNIENMMNAIEQKITGFDPNLKNLLNIDFNILNGIC